MSGCSPRNTSHTQAECWATFSHVGLINTALNLNRAGGPPEHTTAPDASSILAPVPPERTGALQIGSSETVAGETPIGAHDTTAFRLLRICSVVDLLPEEYDERVRPRNFSLCVFSYCARQTGHNIFRTVKPHRAIAGNSR